MSIAAGRLPVVAAAASAGAAVWFSFGTLAVLDVDGVRVGVLPSAWVVAVTIVLGILVAFRSRLSWPSCVPLFLSLLITLPWLPLPIPDVFLVWSGPAVLFAWSAVAMGMLTLLAHGTRFQGFVLVRDPRLAPRVASVLAFTAFLVVRLCAAGLPNGDEPHYLVIAQSLINDGDIRIANNYQQGDYLQYWGGFLRPHFSAATGAGDLYSVHAPGLPAVVAPALRTGGYWGVVVWLAALVALGSAFVWKAGYVLTRDVGAAWFAWAAVTLTAPVVLHGTLVYPDAVAGAVLAAGTLGLVIIGERTRLAALQQDGERRIQYTVWGPLWLGAAVSLLPWLHTRLALLAFVLACVLLLRFRTAVHLGIARWRDVVAFAIPIVVSLTGWIAFFRIIYGTFSPSAPYGDEAPIAAARVATGLLGLMVDQEFGMVPNAPVHLLWVIGFWAIFRRHRRLALELGLIAAPYVIASSGYPVWYAGASPPARFLVPVVFPAGVGLATLWASQDGRRRSMSLALLGLSIVVAGALAFGGDGSLAYNQGTGRARWLDWVAPLVDLPRAFPSFFRAGETVDPRASALVAHLVNPAILWGLSLLAGWVLFRVLGRRLPDTGPVRAMLAPCCLLMVFALGVSACWSIAGGVQVTATRAQLRLLRASEPRLRPFGVRLPAVRVFPADAARTHMQLITSRLEAPPKGALLFLRDVPSGNYSLRVTGPTPARGDLFLGIGRATGVAWRWPLEGGQTTTTAFRLPLPASSIVVNGNEEAMRSVERVAMVPTALSRQETGETGVQARDATRFGQVVVFATDDRVLLDTSGFWVPGNRQQEVTFATDSPINAVDMELRNVAIPNHVALQAGRWSTERTLAPGELWRVRVPVLGLGPSYTVRFKVAGGVQTSNGLLGCRVELR